MDEIGSGTHWGLEESASYSERVRIVHIHLEESDILHIVNFLLVQPVAYEQQGHKLTEGFRISLLSV